MEKQLGISGKKEIEDKVGIAEFTRLCRESVLEHVDEFERLTERIGYWIDTEHAYYTYHPSYVESVWWNLKQLFDRGLLYEDYKVIPYCPRCETGLSSHELGQPGVYYDETDESAYVDFASPTRTIALTSAGHASCGVDDHAVDADLERGGRGESRGDLRRRRRRGGGRRTRRERVWRGGDAERDLSRDSRFLGLHYERPFSDVALPEGVDANYVVGAEYVTIEDGTGLVHQSPGFGEIDRQIARENGLPTLQSRGPEGTFNASVPWLAGQHVREANHDINDELERRGCDSSFRLHPLAPALLALWNGA